MQMRDERGRFCKRAGSKLIAVVGWKGFDSDFSCRGKQYKEHTTFEESKATLCKNGMHFCAVPWDVLEYYPIFDTHTGELNTFAAVEGEIDITNYYYYKPYDSKRCSKKLTIKDKLSFEQFCLCAMYPMPGKQREILCDINPATVNTHSYKYVFACCDKVNVQRGTVQAYVDSKEVLITSATSMVYNVHKNSVIRALPDVFNTYVAGKKGTKIITKTKEVVIDNINYFEDTWYCCSEPGSIRQVFKKGVLAKKPIIAY